MYRMASAGDMMHAMTVSSLLDRPMYLYSEVDQLVGLRSGTARRWINGYERGGKEYEPILRRSASDTDWVTWGEFVETRVLADYRNLNIPTGRLRTAVEELRQMFDMSYPLAHLQPYLAASNGEPGLMVLKTKQTLLNVSDDAVIQNATLAEDHRGDKFAAEITQDTAYPMIVLNPDRCSGQPTFIGRRVTVATIAGMVAAGEHREDLAADYGLSLAQVDSATTYTSKYKLVA
jgi:uncharacterized protein (DUF433 family)